MRKYQVTREHVVGENNMVWLADVAEIISSRLGYLYHEISSAAIEIQMLEVIFSGVREESL